MDLVEWITQIWSTAQGALPQAPDPVEANVNYDPFELQIGGESLSRIYLNLICKYKGKGELPSSDIFFNKAYSVKKKRLFKMGELDPGGVW